MLKTGISGYPISEWGNTADTFRHASIVNSVSENYKPLFIKVTYGHTNVSDCSMYANVWLKLFVNYI